MNEYDMSKHIPFGMFTGSTNVKNTRLNTKKQERAAMDEKDEYEDLHLWDPPHPW
jgi:hypothetical protein